MEVALDNYESKTLKAPFSGKFVEIFIEEGNFKAQVSILKIWSGKRVSNPRQPAWKASALPTELFPPMVGVRGFEPPTPCSQSRCAAKLRYTPKQKYYIVYKVISQQSQLPFPAFWETYNTIINKNEYKMNSLLKIILYIYLS
jgi:hypothetical protein